MLHHDASTTSAQDMRDVSTGVISHLYAGQCPDTIHPDDRDPACSACRILDNAPAA